MSLSGLDLIHALKASSDPSAPGGKSKIEIATEAWEDESFYIPGKAELLCDFILGQLAKDKENTVSSILDLRYWTLLHALVTSGGSQRSRLVSGLNSFPLVAILLKYFTLLEGHSHINADLLQVSTRCLISLWALTSPKLPIDSVLECFGGYLVFALGYDDNDCVARFGMSIISTLRSAWSNFANKKKWCINYVNKYLPAWLEYCRSRHGPSPPNPTLSTAVYHVGIEIIFNSDTLKNSSDRNDGAFLKALQSILMQTPSTTSMLPRIYRSYIQRLKAHKNAIFDHGSGQSSMGVGEKVSEEALRFYASCQSLLGTLKLDRTIASTRAVLLALIEEDAGCSQSRPDIDVTLSKDVHLSLKQLAEGVDEEIQGYAIDCLCSITRIDYNLMRPSLQTLMTCLLLISRPKAFDLLHLLSDYHVKTRSMDTYIHSSFEILDVQHLAQCQINGPDIYSRSSISVLLHPTYLLRLRNGIQGFLTPSQTSEMVHYVAQRLQEAWQRYYSAFSNEPSTNGDELSMGADEATALDLAAVAYSHTARLASVVLASLSGNSISAQEQDSLRQALVEIDAVLAKVVLKKLLKTTDLEVRTSWTAHIVAAAALRLHYALCTHDKWGSSMRSWPKLLPKLTTTFQANNNLPELQLELFRMLIYSGKDDIAALQVALGRALTFIEGHVRTGVAWDGSTWRLSPSQEGSARLALALLHLILQRWLVSINSLLLKPQLVQLVKILISAYAVTSPSSGLSASAIARQALCSSQLWELHTLRDAFITSISNNIHQDLSGIPDDAPQSAILAYECLLSIPVDYLPRSSRLEMVKRAQALDTVLSGQSTRNSMRSLLILRTFVIKNIYQLGHSDISPFDTLLHLLDHHRIGADSELDLVTLDLVSGYFRFLLSTGHLDHPLSDLLVKLSQADLMHASILQLSALRFVDLLTNESQVSQLSERVQSDARALYQNWRYAIAPQITALLDDDTASLDTHILSIWIRVLHLGRWLGVTGGSNPIDKFGSRLLARLSKVQRIGRVDNFDAYTSSCITILIEELACSDSSHRLSQLDTILAAYIATYPQTSDPSGETVEGKLSKTVSQLSLEEFSYGLSQVASLATTDVLDVEKKSSVLTLMDVFLRETPQGCLKIIQRFSSRCFKHFADIIVSTPESLRTQILRFVSRSCSERPASLRPVDVGNIWSILSSTLEPSNVHHDSTSHARFQEIATIINSVMRLRRDLLAHGLPQLSSILRRLLLCLRTIRPNLGATQMTMVTNTFPPWIAPHDPLDASAARTLARLIETINAKTLGRGNFQHQELQKSESLAKPFSKHASYILKAYVDAMNDPLCILPLPIRKELRSGLYVLCGLLNDHSRSALMASALDAGGKLVLKTLWQEYEKQRYQGQG